MSDIVLFGLASKTVESMPAHAQNVCVSRRVCPSLPQTGHVRQPETTKTTPI